MSAGVGRTLARSAKRKPEPNGSHAVSVGAHGLLPSALPAGRHSFPGSAVEELRPCAERVWRLGFRGRIPEAFKCAGIAENKRSECHDVGQNLALGGRSSRVLRISQPAIYSSLLARYVW